MTKKSSLKIPDVVDGGRVDVERATVVVAEGNPTPEIALEKADLNQLCMVILVNILDLVAIPAGEPYRSFENRVRSRKRAAMELLRRFPVWALGEVELSRLAVDNARFQKAHRYALGDLLNINSSKQLADRLTFLRAHGFTTGE